MVIKQHRGVRDSFSRQWSFFKEGDRTWCQTLCERESMLLKEADCHASWLKDKRVLDAGCGNGTVSQCFCSLGAKVTGIDISECVTANRKRFPDVKFLQADIMELPFKDDCFDMVYSKGVIHHTYDSKIAFDSLSRLVKRGGRLYVWVYSHSKGFKRFLLRYLKPVTRSMPAPLQRIVFPVLAVMRMAIEGYNYSEAMVNIYDLLACPYRYEHTEDEVIGWFRKAGFKDMKVTERAKVGFGVCGTRSAK